MTLIPLPTARLSIINNRPLRSCEGCTQCCSVLAVGTPLLKPYHQPCQHLDGQGCSIYSEKPDVCTDYECLFLAGLGTEADRPNISGLLWNLRIDNGWLWADCHECHERVLHNFSQRKFQSLIDSIPTVLGRLAKLCRGVCIFPFGVPVVASFEDDESSMLFRQTCDDSGIFLYLGPCNAEKKLVRDGKVLNEEDVFQEMLRRIEG